MRARTASITAAEAPGSQAKTWQRSSTFGQEMFTSTAVTPEASDSRAASSAYSSTVPPAIDTTARAPLDSSQGRSRCRKAPIPGPCSPIELSMPLGVSAIRGVGRPLRGASITDLVTTAPILATSKNWASSRPAPAHPDAARIGFGSSTWASRLVMSTAMTGPSRRGPGRRAGPRPVRLRPAGSLPARLPGLRARLPPRRAKRVERDGPDVVPADQVATEHRAVHAGPGHPGHAILPHHRQHAGHAHPGPAGHRLLHQGLHRDVVPAGQHGHRAEHPHRPAGVDHVGPGLVDDLGEQVGHLAAGAQRAVLGGNHRAAPAAPRGERPEHPVRAGRAQQVVHLAAAGAQLAAEREQRRAAVPAAHEQRVHRIPRDRERPAQWSRHVEGVPGPALGQPPGARPGHREHELHRAAVVGAHLVNGEHPAHGQHGPLDLGRDQLGPLSRHGVVPGRKAASPASPGGRPPGTPRWPSGPATSSRGLGPRPGGRPPGTPRWPSGPAASSRGPGPRSALACSCSDRTPTSPRVIASMPCTAASRPWIVVTHGIPRRTAAVRISYPSSRGPDCPGLPNGVFTIRSTWPSRIWATMSGSPPGPAPSLCLRTIVARTPWRRSTSPVPRVAQISKPRSASRLTGKIMDRLSTLATDTNARPLTGRVPYAAAWDFA